MPDDHNDGHNDAHPGIFDPLMLDFYIQDKTWFVVSLGTSGE